jgi:hypothetical protein
MWDAIEDSGFAPPQLAEPVQACCVKCPAGGGAYSTTSWKADLLDITTTLTIDSFEQAWQNPLAGAWGSPSLD